MSRLMPMSRSRDKIADPEIADAELHPGTRLRYIQRRIQEEEGLRLSIDQIAYVLKLDGDFERESDLDRKGPLVRYNP